MNKISPKAHIDNSVKLGKGNIIEPFACIVGDTIIGDNNYIGTGVSIGTLPRQIQRPHNWEAERLRNTIAKVRIGSGCTIFENSTIHSSVFGKTVVEDYVSLGCQSHIAHDVIIRKKAIISPGCLIAGGSIIQEYAQLGLGVNIHQRSVIGSYSIVGMNSAVKGYVYPFIKAVGIPAKYLDINTIGLQRNNFSSLKIDLIKNHIIKTESLPIEIQHVISNFYRDIELYKRPDLILNIINYE